MYFLDQDLLIETGKRSVTNFNKEKL